MMTSQPMQVVEQHIIDRHDPRWAAIDQAAWFSKNIYNAANYRVRQAFIFHDQHLNYNALEKHFKQHRLLPDQQLPLKVVQQVLKQVDHDWQAFFAAHAAWQEHPEKFKGRPKLPGYKDTATGRNLLVYTDQAVSRRAFKQKGVIQPSQLGISIKTMQTSFDQLRIVPRKTHYVVEIVYTTWVEPAAVDGECIASIDLGVDNLATVTFNQPGVAPLLVNGRPLKAINQFYNKQRARLQSHLSSERSTSRRLDAITDKRNRRINAYLHLASRRIIETLIHHRIGTLVIGKNDGWKQGVNLGKRTNQTFVHIPHARFIHMLTYKAQLVGITVMLTEESYTSKCSFLDNEPIGKHEIYAGKRVKRWLFVAGDGRQIHADVNGSYNIMRKVIPNAVEAGGIAAPVVVPVRVTPH
jgi:putative transposase